MKKIIILLIVINLSQLVNLFSIEKDEICPYELVSFDAVAVRDTANQIVTVNLKWVTASEMNTDFFIVQRIITDTLLFINNNDSKIITIEHEYRDITQIPASGNSTTQKVYKFTDELTMDSGSAVYRLKCVDKDSSFIYSNELRIENSPYSNIEDQEKISTLVNNIFPNPAKDYLTFEINLPSLSLVEVKLIDIKGHIVVMKEIGNIYSAKYLETIDISGLSSGQYLLIVKVGSIIETKKIVIVK